MKCPYCDQEIPDGSASCPVCMKTLIPVPEDGENGGKKEEQETFAENPADETAKKEPEAFRETPEGGAEKTEHGSPEAAETAGLAGDGEPAAPVLAPAVPERKNGKKWVAGAAVAAVIVVAGIAFWQMNQKDPKDIVIDAFKGVTAEGQTNPGEEIFGWEAMADMMYSSSYKMGMGLQLESFLGMTDMAGAGFDYSAREDREARAMDMDFGIQYAGMDLVNAKLYLDDSELAVALPGMTDKVFALNMAEDLDAQAAASPCLGKILSDTGFSIQGYADYMKKANELAHSETPMFDLGALWERYKTGSEAIDNLKAAMTVEKGEKQSFTVDGKEVSCDGYDVVLSKDALVEFFTETKDFFLADETLKKDMAAYLELVYDLNQSVSGAYGLSGGYGETADGEELTPEEQQEQLWVSADQELEKLLSQLNGTMGDISLAVYVTDDGKLASFDYSTSIAGSAPEASDGSGEAQSETDGQTSGETVKLYGTVGFKGGYNRMANVDASLVVEEADGQKVTFTANKTGEYEAGKTYQTGLKLGMESGGSAAQGADAAVPAVNGVLDMVGSYSMEDGSYSMKASVASGGQELGYLSMGGIVEDLVPGTSIRAAVDSLKLCISGGSAAVSTDESAPEEISLFELSGSFNLEPFEEGEGVTRPEGESFDVMAATEEEWNAVGMEIYLKLMEIMSGMNQTVTAE